MSGMRRSLVGLIGVGLLAGGVVAATPASAAPGGCRAASPGGTASCSFVSKHGVVLVNAAAKNFVVLANGKVCAGGAGGSTVQSFCVTKKGAKVRAVVTKGFVSATDIG
jgi:hypothetical protein